MIDVKLSLYVDLDDTLLYTRDWLVKQMYLLTGYRHNKSGFITSENSDGNITKVLALAEFMRDTPPNLEMIEVLRQLSDRVSIKICTHRGYHPKGKQYTEELLDTLQLDFITGVEYLCAYKQPDKIEYLRSLEVPFILLDDNPKFSNVSPLEDTGEVMVYTQEWNKRLDIPDNLRINNPSEFISKLELNEIYLRNVISTDSIYITPEELWDLL